MAADRDVASWLDEVDRLIPNGLHRPAAGVGREWLSRLCATVIHLSTAEHDVLNNVVWDYSTLSWIVPTVAPASGQPMDQRRAFDLLATIIGTRKPYNMLLTSGVPTLALDDRARAVMQRWIDDLVAIQKDMDREPCIRGVEPLAEPFVDESRYGLERGRNCREGPLCHLRSTLRRPAVCPVPGSLAPLCYPWPGCTRPPEKSKSCPSSAMLPPS